MGRLVGDLLDFSAIDSGVLRLVQRLVRPRARARGRARAAWATARRRSSSSTTRRTLPAVWADHDRLEQVFVNLLENAVRHASGVTRISVTFVASIPRRGTVDRARHRRRCGIAPSLVDRVFLPHERGTADDAGAGSRSRHRPRHRRGPRRHHRHRPSAAGHHRRGHAARRASPTLDVRPERCRRRLIDAVE